MSYEKVKQAKCISIGIKQTLKAIEQKKAKEIIVAKDADYRYISEVIEASNEAGIDVIYVDSMKKLGKICGIEVNAATTAILED